MSMHSIRAVSPHLLCAGDSLAAGTGTTIASQTFPYVLGSLFSPQRASINAGVGGESAAQILVRVNAYCTDKIRDILIIWAGRNGVLALAPAAIIADIQTMINRVPDGRYLVLTIPPKTDGTEDPTDASGILVATFNSLIISTWPNNHVDAATVIGMDPSGRSDGLHLLAPTQRLVAQAVYNKIIAMGW